jgi:hypothetical protein
VARPLKEGLDYFPLDTNFDEKIQALESVFKNDGLVWIIKFWQAAYRTNDGEVSLAGYHGIIHAENSRVTPEQQKKIIKLCLEIGLLTETENNKFTSNGIKRRIGHIIAERKRWRCEHKISIITEDNYRDNHRDNLQETGESKVKVKESKVKESKVKNICIEPSETRLVQNYFYSTFKNIVSKDYAADYGKDGAIFKGLLRVATVDEVKGAVDLFFKSEDEFITKAGFTVGVFKSQFNKLRSQKPVDPMAKYFKKE